MFQKLEFDKLNAQQRDNYNFHKVASRLVDYGYNSLRLADDWLGADFLAIHVDGVSVLRIQLKPNFSLSTKYSGKDLQIAFLAKDACYVFPHDEMLAAVLKRGQIGETKSWKTEGKYRWPSLPGWAREIIEKYSI
jgi:hypothetical protein